MTVKVIVTEIYFNRGKKSYFLYGVMVKSEVSCPARRGTGVYLSHGIV